ncbi:NRDE family protein [Halobellus captivus]|uniref:NRDE family protein n=1 Tax=Halobellus captivus TaxID=2592614 RepID=UPI00119FD7C1|nr:NRDE family protein [Halobellus captivus]
MCTLTLAWRVFEDAPLVVAANRDESLDRESEGPAVSDGNPSFVAPRDVEAGGTWIGYNESGVFCGVTNRWVDVPNGGERSRGLLVRDVLGTESADDARTVVEAAVDADTYDGFNLVVAERGRIDDATSRPPKAFLFEWDGELRVRELDPGVHVVVNVGIDGESFEPEWDAEAGTEQAANAVRVREALEPIAAEDSAAWRDRAADVLGDHDYGVCVHDRERRFGTRSSSLVTLSADGTSEFRFADGPPCETSFRPVESHI